VVAAKQNPVILNVAAPQVAEVGMPKNILPWFRAIQFKSQSEDKKEILQ
jgi:hypothetical protein